MFVFSVFAICCNIIEVVLLVFPLLSSLGTDGMGNSSEPKGYTLNIVPVNDVPLITGYEGQVEMDEDTELNISIETLMVDDPDNSFPGDFSFTVFEGNNYSVNGETIEPSENYFGTLSVAVSVNDGEAESEQFEISIDVLPVNDAPTAVDLSKTMDEDGGTIEVETNYNNITNTPITRFQNVTL